MKEPATANEEEDVLKLRELLWAFIEYHDLETDRTGDVLARAEEVLSSMRRRLRRALD